MFDPTSRYFRIEETQNTFKGRTITYKRRRFLPQLENTGGYLTVKVLADDWPDLVAYRALGNSELFWQLGDGNGVMDPFELTSQPDRILNVPSPQSFQGQS